MDDISEVNMDYTVTVYFMQTWHDPRLILDPDGKYGPKGWLSNCSITLATSIGEDIWVSTRKDYHGTILWYRLWYKVYTVKRLVYTAYLFRIKTPDVFFINEKVSFKHTVTMKNAMFRLLPDGNVIYSAKDPILKNRWYAFYDYKINKSFLKCALQCWYRVWWNWLDIHLINKYVHSKWNHIHMIIKNCNYMWV